jgi:lysophospholipase L1-like esterase
MAPAKPPARDGVPILVGTFGVAGACIALGTLLPGVSQYQPWKLGEPLPIWRRWFPSDGRRVHERAAGELSIAKHDVTAPVSSVTAEITPSGDTPSNPTDAATAAALPPRPPGVAMPLEDPDFRGLAPLFRALAAPHDKVRAIHLGDSLLAADGLAGRLRERLQARWGDGGPGFIAAGIDPAWNVRVDVTARRSGDWQTFTLLNGGATDHRYGLGGIVTTAAPGATLTVLTPRRTWRTREPMHRWEVFHPRPTGRFTVYTDDRPVSSDGAATAGTDAGFTRLTIEAAETTTLWGVSIERDAPGLVWDTLGVVGIGTASLKQQDAAHLRVQVAARAPSLIVVQLGGNELGYDPIRADQPADYIPWYADAMHKLRAGAPDAGCLVIGPLDQGVPGADPPRAKHGVSTLIAAQRQFAASDGCAFWDARAAMGGKGAIQRWASRERPLAWTDLVHLSMPGQQLMGDLLADAILAHFDAWTSQRDAAARPAPTADDR